MTALRTAEPGVVALPDPDTDLIRLAIEKGTDAEQLSKIVDLVRQMKRDRAAEGFAAALAQFQAECPTVFKGRTAKVKENFTYAFASYDDVMAGAGPVLARCGLAVSFTTESVPNALKVTCRVRHTIHVEETVVTVPIPAMTVNDTQRYGAAISYAKRFAVCAALNIVTTDEDDDAEQQFERISARQAATLSDLIERKGVRLEDVLNFAQAARVEDIPAAMFARLEKHLRDKPDRKEK